MGKKLSCKRGLSGIITAVIMVTLVMAAAVIVWGVVNRMIQEQMESAEACFGNYDKVTINSMYTCYEFVGENDYHVHFSLSIGSIDVDSIIISVSSEGSTNSYTITNNEETINGLANYDSTGFGTDLIILPNKNAGKTYIANGFTEKPDLIQILPVINKQQCEISDTLSNIEICF
jgi:hypothetical protein